MYFAKTSHSHNVPKTDYKPKQTKEAQAPSVAIEVTVEVPVVDIVEEVPAVNTVVVEKEEDEDDGTEESYIKKKEGCSFCAGFFGSPCKSQFILWSRCVDRTKKSNGDFVAECSAFTRGLMECVGANEDYFEGLHAKNAEDAAEAEEQSGESHHSSADSGVDSTATSSTEPRLRRRRQPLVLLLWVLALPRGESNLQRVALWVRH